MFASRVSNTETNITIMDGSFPVIVSLAPYDFYIQISFLHQADDVLLFFRSMFATFSICGSFFASVSQFHYTSDLGFLLLELLNQLIIHWRLAWYNPPSVQGRVLACPVARRFPYFTVVTEPI